jgi:secondary thiamine-phosphate synthase enzyme
MISKCLEFKLQTRGHTDIHDITGQVQEVVSGEGLKEGLATVFTPGATASVTAIEYESGAVADLKDAVERMAPDQMHYQHDARWGDGNGFSHVRSALGGPSLSVPVSGGTLVLGTWQQIVLLDHDNRKRSRRVVVQIMGTN